MKRILITSVIIGVAMLMVSGCTTAAEVPENPSGVPEIHYPTPMGSYRLGTFASHGQDISEIYLLPATTIPEFRAITQSFDYKGARYTILITPNMNVYDAAVVKNRDYWIDIQKDSTYESEFAHIRDPALTPLYDSINSEIDRIVAENGYTETDRLNLIVAYIRSIEFADSDILVAKYPIQTVVDGTGDCDDTSLLLAGVLQNAGYDSATMIYCLVEEGKSYDHGVAGIKLNTSETYSKDVEKIYDGKVAYIPIETTADWYVGRPNPKYSGVETMVYYSTGTGNPTPPNLYV